MELTTEQKLEIAIDQLKAAGIHATLHSNGGDLRHHIQRTLVVLGATPPEMSGVDLGTYLAHNPQRCGLSTQHGPCERPSNHDGPHAVARESFLRSTEQGIGPMRGKAHIHQAPAMEADKLTSRCLLCHKAITRSDADSKWR